MKWRVLDSIRFVEVISRKQNRSEDLKIIGGVILIWWESLSKNILLKQRMLAWRDGQFILKSRVKEERASTKFQRLECAQNIKDFALLWRKSFSAFSQSSGLDYTCRITITLWSFFFYAGSWVTWLNIFFCLKDVL